MCRTCFIYFYCFDSYCLHVISVDLSGVLTNLSLLQGNIASVPIDYDSENPEHRDRGFPGLCLEDSPLGVRFADFATAFPAGVNAAAS
jgi:hypothetical protein